MMMSTMMLDMIQREKSELALVFNLSYDSYKSSRGCFNCFSIEPILYFYIQSPASL